MRQNPVGLTPDFRPNPRQRGILPKWGRGGKGQLASGIGRQSRRHAESRPRQSSRTPWARTFDLPPRGSPLGVVDAVGGSPAHEVVCGIASGRVTPFCQAYSRNSPPTVARPSDTHRCCVSREMDWGYTHPKTVIAPTTPPLVDLTFRIPVKIRAGACETDVAMPDFAPVVSTGMPRP